jgi:hypothetical protein
MVSAWKRRGAKAVEVCDGGGENFEGAEERGVRFDPLDCRKRSLGFSVGRLLDVVEEVSHLLLLGAQVVHRGFA